MHKLAEITINYKPSIPTLQMPKVCSSVQIYNLILPFWEDISHRESFKIILLNRANRVLGISLVSVGGLSCTIADPKIVFQTALKANASHVVLAHNHPSGNREPSHEDRKLTEQMVALGKLLDLPVLDHLILAEDNYYSFSDAGLI